MREGAASAFGARRGEALEPVGRARRWRCERGELWELAVEDRAAAKRLLALGGAGVGGFVDGGVDGETVWLVRAAGQAPLSRELRQRKGPWPWREAVERARRLGVALAACESEGLFPGPVRPRDVWTDGTACGIAAEPLVRALLGAPGRDAATQTTADRWMPAEQASGAAWDNAANRYVLGLILYRLLAGEHPFGGKGLRLGLEERAGRGAPPFAPEVASELPAGLQSACLGMLHPSAGERPASASAIVETLGALLADAPRPAAMAVEVEDAPEPSAPPPRAEAPRRRGRVGLVLAATLGLAVGGALTALSEPPSRSRDPVAPRAPLTSDTATAETCAGCHPMQASEWQRSVMAHSARSPLFLALEMLIEEQVGRSFDCEHGAGILREAAADTACRDRTSGLPVTGSGGALWCVNCHAPGENLREAMPPWDGRAASARSRRPLNELLPPATLEGIGCAFCHQAHGPVRPGDLAAGRYEGNPFWTSARTGQRFPMRPEDRRGLPGIANSGYALDPGELIASAGAPPETLAGGVHARPSAAARSYLRSSEFCGACHDVRLFGSDGLSHEPFKRLRNAYTEWAGWARTERAAGREPATCQGCHMSEYPGVCVPGDASAAPPLASALERACPPGTRFEARRPGEVGDAFVSAGSARPTRTSPHYFSGVDVPLGEAFAEGLVDDPTIDVRGVPRGARQRRDLLLGATFRLELGDASRPSNRLVIPVELENVGAGHRVPAGFSQEREIWVHLRVTDAAGRLVYEVGRVDDAAEDLHDKVFLRVRTDGRLTDGLGRPLGLFGADIADGPDVPRWETVRRGTDFRGQGLINLQNGFLRCVRCIGFVDALGRCQPGIGQGRTRADRYADGAFDPDTGECRSNLVGENAFFETYFPVGSLDADRGVVRGPDAIVDTRSALPGVRLTYTYDVPIGSAPGPLRAEARLLFRAFPPFLIRAFAAYERARAEAGERPGGPLVTDAMLERLEVVELARVEAAIP